MKKFFFLMILAITVITASAQKGVRLNGYAAYAFDESFDYYYDNNNFYSGMIEGGFQWGVGIEYMINPAVCVELIYLNRSADAPTTYQNGIATTVKNTTMDLSLNYVLLGSDYHFQKPHSRLEGYFGIFLGWFGGNATNPESGNKGDASRFAWMTRLGGNIWASEKVGVKVQCMLLSSVNGAGGSMYFGTGGVGVGLSTYSTFYQFSLGGGITFKLGH